MSAADCVAFSPSAGIRSRRNKARCWAPVLSQAPVGRRLRVDPLYRRDAGERAAAAPRGDFELEPGMSFGVPGRVAGGLADDGAAVHMLPVRPGVMPADGLAVRQQRRDRLTERPGELAVRACLALVDLRAFGMQGEHDGFAGAAMAWGGASRRAHTFDRRCPQQKQGERNIPSKRHHNSLVLAPKYHQPETYVPYAAIAFSRFSATLSRKPVVDSQRWSAPTSSARSLVM